MEDESEESQSAPPQPPGPVASLCSLLILPVCFLCPFWFVSGILLHKGYSMNSGAYKARGTAKDFVSIGQRCRVESIEYQAITGGEPYSCDEIWNYDFVVLPVEGVLEAEVDADYFGLRTVREQRPACGNKACGECSEAKGKYAMNEGQPVENGQFATECWLLKEGVEANSFWHCSEPYYDDTSCYLLNDPKDILNAHLKAPRKEVIAGWVLFGVAVLCWVYSCARVVRAERAVRIRQEQIFIRETCGVAVRM